MYRRASKDVRLFDSMPQPVENLGHKPLSRSEAARHASLVRWKKEQPFAQPNQDRIANRVRELLAKNKAKGAKGKGKGGKAKPSAEQRAQAKQDQIDNNRSAVYDKTGLGDDGVDAVNALESGTQPKNADDLIKRGLAEKDRSGNVRLTTAGHAFLHAADKGDTGAVTEALSHGSDRLVQAADKEQAKADRAGKQLSADVKRETAKRAKAKAAAGGGSKKPSKPVEQATAPDKERSTDQSPSQQKQTENRAKVASEMADSDSGLSPSGSAALTAFADGAQLPKEMAGQLADMGLLEADSTGAHRLSYAGRATINAMNRGDTRAALDAMSRAADRTKAKADSAARTSERDKAREAATADREKTKADRAKAQADRTAKEDASRARIEQARIEAARSRNRKAWFAIKQDAQDRAMFANMGGGKGKGKGYDKSKSKLWEPNKDGTRNDPGGLFGTSYNERQKQAQASAAQRTAARTAKEKTDAERQAFFDKQTPTASQPVAPKIVKQSRPITTDVSGAAAHEKPERYAELEAQTQRVKMPQAGWNQTMSDKQGGYLGSLATRAREGTKEGTVQRRMADELIGAAKSGKLTKWEASQFIDAMGKPRPMSTLLQSARDGLREGKEDAPWRALLALPNVRAALIDFALTQDAVAEGLPF